MPDERFFGIYCDQWVLFDEETIARLTEAGVSKLVFSVASLDEQLHDYFRGMSGSYRRLMRAIEYRKENQFPGEVYVNTIIKGKNLDSIIPLAEWVQQDSLLGGIGYQAIAQPFFTPYEEHWYRNEEYRDLWPQDEGKVRAVFDTLIGFKKEKYKIGNSIAQLELFKQYYRDPHSLIRQSYCNFGEYIMNVTPLGEVFLCVGMEPVGNIHRESIGQIWNSPQAQAVRERMHRCSRNCNNIINCWFRGRNEF